MLCLNEHSGSRLAYCSNSHFTNDLKFDIEVKVDIGFATSSMIIYLLTSLQLRFEDVALYFVLVLC